MTSTTTTTIMLSSPTSLCSSSCITKSALLVHRKVPNFGVFTAKSHVGLNVFAQWSGLKHLGLRVTTRLLTKERKKKFRGVKVSASLFGVGAPEALVIGVVALLVFGPKGLAEVARNLGKTLRAFQPTIRELQEVSREFKSTLEREIGLDDIPNSTQSASDRMNTAPRPPSTASTDDPQAAVEINTAPRPSSTVTTEESQAAADPNGVASPNTAYSTEELLKITEEQLKASAAAQRQEEATNVEESKSEPQNQQQVVVKENADREGPSSERPETKT